MTNLFIKTNYIKAAQIFVAKDSARYYLEGINIEFFDRHCTLVSTDGHRLFIAHNEFVNDERVPEWLIGRSFILPIDAVKKSMSGNKTMWTQLTLETNFAAATKIIIDDVSALPIDGKYPYWRNLLLIKDQTGQPAQYNALYLADFAKAAKLLGSKSGYFQIHHNGVSAAPISFGDEKCAGLIMPIKTGLPDDNYKIAFGRALIGSDEEKIAAE